MANNPNYDEDPETVDSAEQDNRPLPGNRPAENALRATTESELNMSWQGGEGAADFLGLDQEIGRPAEPVSINLDEQLAAGVAEAAPPAAYEGQATIPLQDPIEMATEVLAEAGMPMDLAGVAEQLDAYEAPTEEYQGEYIEETDAAEDETNWLLDSNAESEEATGEFGYEDAAGNDLEVSEALESSFSERSTSHNSRRLAVLAGIVVLAAGSSWYFGTGANQEQPFEIASVDQATPNTNSTPTPVSTPNGNEASTGSQSTGTSSAEDEALLSDFAGLISAVDGGTAATSSPAGPSSVETGEPSPESAVTAEGPTVQDPGADGRIERVVQINPGEMLVLPDYSSNLRLASESDLASLWSEDTIPFEKFEAAKRLMTPNVGRVRVVITGDEIFEGTLYAVGEGQVWIDSKIGRVALAAHTVRDVQQLSGTDRTPELGGAGSQNLAGLPRVRVRAAGGNFYGKIVAREGNLVTLIPDAGGRIRLRSEEVEIVGNIHTSLVRSEVQ